VRDAQRFCETCGAKLETKKTISDYDLFQYIMQRGATIRVPGKHKKTLENLIGPLEPDSEYKQLFDLIKADKSINRVLKIAKSSTKIRQDYKRDTREISEIREKFREYFDKVRKCTTYYSYVEPSL